MGEILVVVMLAFVAASVGVGLGIFYLAPRISRLADPDDEDPGARND
ncbi:MAG: hypothetical protein HYX54_07100 [Chloroflexi bacterium]|nr:hypothetical protein [Chloroflexota bacterium]